MQVFIPVLGIAAKSQVKVDLLKETINEKVVTYFCA